MRSVQSIFRYPIKGLSAEPVASAVLEAGKPFPFDRVFALARPGARLDPAEPRWAKKGFFLMLMLEEALAQFHTTLDPLTLQLVIRPGPIADETARRAALLTADLRTAGGRAQVEEFFQRQVPALKGVTRLVHAPNGHFMDKPDSVVSCINLATLRALEETWGYAVHPLRFRANFYIEGLEPWEEFDWIGREIRLGDVRFRVERRNGRCGATNVNPITAERDLDIPGSLRRSFGHKDVGVYLAVLSHGEVAVGDTVSLLEPRAASAVTTEVFVPSGPSVASAEPVPMVGATPPGGSASPVAAGSYICRGCYFVYEQATGAAGIPPGTAFTSLSPEFRCPDCGTEKGNFRALSARSF